MFMCANGKFRIKLLVDKLWGLVAEIKKKKISAWAAILIGIVVLSGCGCNNDDSQKDIVAKYKIAFCSNLNIWVMNPDGSEQRRLTDKAKWAKVGRFAEVKVRNALLD